MNGGRCTCIITLADGTQDLARKSTFIVGKRIAAQGRAKEGYRNTVEQLIGGGEETVAGRVAAHVLHGSSMESDNGMGSLLDGNIVVIGIASFDGAEIESFGCKAACDLFLIGVIGIADVVAVDFLDFRKMPFGNDSPAVAGCIGEGTCKAAIRCVTVDIAGAAVIPDLPPVIRG